MLIRAKAKPADLTWMGPASKLTLDAFGPAQPAAVKAKIHNGRRKQECSGIKKYLKSKYASSTAIMQLPS
jgi:hypothetical protein